MVRIMDRLDRLQDPADLTERADLAHQLVRSAARYRDVMARALAEPLEAARRREASFVLLDDADQRDLVEAMDTVLQRTSHLDPRNAHTGDPQGLEDALQRVMTDLTARLRAEDRALPGLLAELDGAQRDRIEQGLGKALRSASEHPRPPRSALGRAVRNLAVKLDDTVEDVAAPQHPGADVVDGQEPTERNQP